MRDQRLVYGANVIASLAAAALTARYDWQIVSIACTPLLGGSPLCLLWCYGTGLRPKRGR